jgi:hypothetical protein
MWFILICYQLGSYVPVYCSVRFRWPLKVEHGQRCCMHATSSLWAQSKRTQALPWVLSRRRRDSRAMSMAQRTVAKKSGTHVGAPPEKCPYCPSSVATSGHSPLALAAASSVLGTLDSLPTVISQTESKWRISRDRSRQKRGPPLTSFI